MKSIIGWIFGLCCAATVAAQPANQNISGGLIFEGEPYLAVDPADGHHIVVAWIGAIFGQQPAIKTRTSFDGGQTWAPVTLLPHLLSTHKSADPSIAFDANGDVVACYVDYRQSPDSGAIVVTRSTDGGLTWGALHVALDAYDDGSELPVDRPWLRIGQGTGPFGNRWYITSKPGGAVPAPNRPYLVHSDDGGSTWSPWRYIDTTGALVGSLIQAPMAVPAVQTDGSLHIIYPSFVFSQNPFAGYIHARSTNGGASFTYQEAWFGQTNSNNPNAKVGYHLFPDPSDAQHLAFVATQNLLGDEDIYMVETRDGGLTWTPPQRINDDPGANGVVQDLSWAGFDEDGDFVITWRDRRNAGSTGLEVGSEIWGAVRWHDSTSFSPNFPISDTLAAWNAILSQSGNDFMCSAFVHDTLCATWGDTRLGRLNIYFAKLAVRTLTPTAIQELSSESIPMVQIFPNPAQDYVEVQGNEILSVQLRSVTGAMLMTTQAGRLDLRALPAGTYVVQVETAQGRMEARLVKQ